MKFVYNITDTKVICIAKYAGRSVKGVAKCHPEDTFDLEYGRALARARCEFKIANKKVKRANSRLLLAFAELDAANRNVVEATKYQDDSLANLMEARKTLEDFEKSFS